MMMFCIDRLKNIFEENPDLVNKIEKKIVELDLMGASDEQRYKEALEIYSEVKQFKDTDNILLMVLIANIVGLQTQLLRILKEELLEYFPRLKHTRCQGIRDHNNYKREVLEMKINEALENNFEQFKKSGFVDTEGALMYQMDYLEKYKKIASTTAKRDLNLSIDKIETDSQIKVVSATDKYENWVSRLRSKAKEE